MTSKHLRIVIIAAILALVSTCNLKTTQENDKDYIYSVSNIEGKAEMASHILQEPKFWEVFVHEVLDKKSWKCSFENDILERNVESDSVLYRNDTIIKIRRKAAEAWRQNETLWSVTILGACKELAYATNGVFINELQKFKVVKALEDFVEHLHYFYRVADIMNTRGHRVKVYGQNGSPIHDIDKLDPVMLVAYSERFEDNKTTSLWNKCVDRHTHSNKHHQANCLWHNCCHQPTKDSCNKQGTMALQEMICDKVSRRLQKNFKGKESEDIWNVDTSYYDGLPPAWLDKAISIMHDLRYLKSNDTR